MYALCERERAEREREIHTHTHTHMLHARSMTPLVQLAHDCVSPPTDLADLYWSTNRVASRTRTHNSHHRSSSSPSSSSSSSSGALVRSVHEWRPCHSTASKPKPSTLNLQPSTLAIPLPPTRHRPLGQWLRRKARRDSIKDGSIESTVVVVVK